MNFLRWTLIGFMAFSSTVSFCEGATEEDDDKAALEIIKEEVKPNINAGADAATTEFDPPAEARAATESTPLNDLAAKDLRSESEIPVFTKASTAQTGRHDVNNRLAMSLGVMALVAFGLILFSRFYSKRRFGVKPHHQIKVLTQFALGPKKNLAIVRVAGESILIGVTDHNISLIKTLSLLDEELPSETPENFSQELDRVDPESHTAAFTMKISNREEGEDFAFGGIKEMVSKKLREMRSL